MVSRNTTRALTVQCYRKQVEGVESSEKVDGYYSIVPSWHPLRWLFLVKGSNAWNRLVSTSYGMLSIVDYQKLVLRYLVTGGMLRCLLSIYALVLSFLGFDF